MPKCTIDGKEVEFTPGENLVKVAERAGIEVPVFCYHAGLSVVAQCRMCLVEIEKMPKLQTACSTNATDGMVVKTTTENVKKGRAGTMEFLLVNHPLDCPICDKSGECDLQDNSYGYGSSYMRTSEERRTYVDVDMGPVIQKNMNRCIHCTRCIRFGDEIAGIHEMVAIQRGGNIDITTIDGKQLQTAYAGNYADICPTGSLTLKDFRFKKRAWMLKHTDTVCEGCSKGCNMEIQHEQNVIYRCVPRENQQINKFWMCDEGRFNYHYTQDPNRILQPQIKSESAGNYLLTNWDNAVLGMKEALEKSKPTFLVASDLTLEEMTTIKEFVALQFKDSKLFHFGTPGVETTAQDGHEDKLLRMLSKTSNLNGAEKLGFAPLTEKMASELKDSVVVFRGGRAKLPKLSAKTKIGVGVFMAEEAEGYHTILPGLAFTEKSGTIVNHMNIEQKIKRSVLPRGGCKAISEILMLLAHKKAKVGAA
jgi:NADH-quinone oxidoreductase subunit G